MSIWFKIMATAGMILALALLGMLVYIIYKNRRKSSDDIMHQGFPVAQGDCVKVYPIPLDDTKTLELQSAYIKIAEEAPYELSDSRTEALYPVSDYAEIGISSLKGTREYQQDMADACVHDWKEGKNNRAVGVLCDGMGGTEGGEKASTLAVSEMMKELSAPWEQFPQVILDALADINCRIYDLIDEETGRRLQAGTTFTAVVMEDRKMYWCSIGDSRIYLFRDGRLFRLTKDHTYGNDLDEMAACGQISESEARNNPGRAALTSYLGIRRLERIHYNSMPEELMEGDIVLQCSDGLYRSLSEAEMEFILKQSQQDVQLAARRLTATAVSKPGGHDNTSVLLLRYKGSDGMRNAESGSPLR